MKLTKKQILTIPELKRKGYTNGEIASRLSVAIRTVQYWIVNLRAAGHDVPRAKKKAIDLTI